MREEREVWIDNAKAIGTVLIIWGHFISTNLGSCYSESISVFLYSFHIPMFFILAGYNAKIDHCTIREYVIKKSKRVLVPAVILYLLSIPILINKVDLDEMSLWTIIAVVFYGRGLCIINEPIWFFICMFQVYLVAKLINIFNSKTSLIITTCLLSFIAGFLCTILPDITSYLGFNKFIIGLFFFSTGMLFRRFKQADIFNAYYIAIIVAIWLLSTYYNGKVSLYGFNLGNYALYTISGIGGSIIYFYLMRKIKKNSLLREYASNTVFIICTHITIVYFFRNNMKSFLIGGTIYMDYVLLLVTLLLMLLYLPTCKSINKYIPILNGR